MFGSLSRQNTQPGRWPEPKKNISRKDAKLAKKKWTTSTDLCALGDLARDNTNYRAV
jgi:hypothetical protein